jgi:hypothetical protein
MKVEPCLKQHQAFIRYQKPISLHISHKFTEYIFPRTRLRATSLVLGTNEFWPGVPECVAHQDMVEYFKLSELQGPARPGIPFESVTPQPVQLYDPLRLEFQISSTSPHDRMKLRQYGVEPAERTLTVLSLLELLSPFQ